MFDISFPPPIFPGFYAVHVQAYMETASGKCISSEGDPRPCQPTGYNVYAGHYLCMKMNGNRSLSCVVSVPLNPGALSAVFLVTTEDKVFNTKNNFTSAHELPDRAVLFCKIEGQTVTCDDKTEVWERFCNGVPFATFQPSPNVPLWAFGLIVATVSMLMVASSVVVYVWWRKRGKLLSVAIVDFREYLGDRTLPKYRGPIRPKYFDAGEKHAPRVRERWNRFDKVVCLFSGLTQLACFEDGRTIERSKAAQLFHDISRSVNDRLIVVTFGFRGASEATTTNQRQIFLLPNQSRALVQSLDAHLNADVDLERLIPDSKVIGDQNLNAVLDPGLQNALGNGQLQNWL